MDKEQNMNKLVFQQSHDYFETNNVLCIKKTMLVWQQYVQHAKIHNLYLESGKTFFKG